MRQLWNHRGLRYTFLSITLLGLFGLGCYEAFIRAGERRWQRIEAKFKDDGGKFSSEIATRGFKSSTPYNPRYIGDWVWRYDPAPKAQ